MEEIINDMPVVDSSSQDSLSDNPLDGRRYYGKVPAMPCFEAVDGIRYDFNFGLRVSFPEGDKKYHLKFSNADTGLALYDADAKPGTIIVSAKKYYIKFNFKITSKETGKTVFEHTLDMRSKNVVVQMPVSTMGDSIGWFSYLERFQKKNRCNLYVAMCDSVRSIFEKQYPEFHFINKDDIASLSPYACYYIGLFFNGDTNYQPVDFRQIGLHRTAAFILGLRNKEELEDIPPRVDLSARKSIRGKYAVIATQASAQCKYSNNPFGWDGVIKFLKENGYRVLCIDRDRVYGTGIIYNHIPNGAEDFTGNLPLQERINIIKDADFFVGLPSGLSWLAWCCKVPVVMISGFSLPNTEFYTPYRVINYDVCNGCWNDMTHQFDHGDYLWCPRHKGNGDRHFECTRFIMVDQVIQTIRNIPSFRGNDVELKK